MHKSVHTDPQVRRLQPRPLRHVNRLLLLAAILLATTLLCGCAAEEPERAALTLGGISGEALWTRISEESPYQRYAEWPGHEGLREGQAPHGVEHRIYVNRPLREALPATVAPAGSIIVKENYNAEGVMAKITVMAKVNGWNSDNNDWFWAAYDAEGTVLAEGDPAGCISCHEGMRGNDFIIVRNLDQPF